MAERCSRTRVVLTTAFTLFCVFCSAIRPHWTAMLHPPESRKSWLAHRQVANNNRSKFFKRAAIGDELGFVLSLIPITPRRRE